MGDKTKISWTEATWSCITGCTPISEGCAHCYAKTMSHRLKEMGQVKYANDFELTLHPDTLAIPIRWKRPRHIFVNSMSDLFHKDVPNEYIAAVYGVMAACPQHTFQVLTKRADVMARWYEWIIDSFDYTEWHRNAAAVCLKYAKELIPDTPALHLSDLTYEVNAVTWPLPNVWVGITAENQKCFNDRMFWMSEVPAEIKFLSCEPLLGPIDLSPWTEYDHAIDWVICGGESGAGARSMDPAWVLGLRDQCVENDILFHFKQWGGVRKQENGCLLEGCEWKEMPER